MLILAERAGFGIEVTPGIWNWKLGGVRRVVRQSFSLLLTPAEYYCNEAFRVPNWVNSGNNDAWKLCKQLKRVRHHGGTLLLLLPTLQKKCKIKIKKVHAL